MLGIVLGFIDDGKKDNPGILARVVLEEREEMRESGEIHWAEARHLSVIDIFPALTCMQSRYERN